MVGELLTANAKCTINNVVSIFKSNGTGRKITHLKFTRIFFIILVSHPESQTLLSLQECCQFCSLLSKSVSILFPKNMHVLASCFQMQQSLESKPPNFNDQVQGTHVLIINQSTDISDRSVSLLLRNVQMFQALRIRSLLKEKVFFNFLPQDERSANRRKLARRK